MEFSHLLKELRKDKNLTHEQLAQKLGYSSAIIGHWEKGIREPKLSAIKAIAVFFDVSTDYLLGFEDEFGAKAKI
ncbi:MAG: helix-turn-helix transcriptional regulator [Firmicutes bacterium]|nr:helix-turn-helix transcriptional regulator [Bacillota bacterium]